MSRILLGVALVLACGGEQAKTDSPEPRDTQRPAASATPTDLNAIDAGASAPEADSCVADCVQSRQMQATSPEQIERDCQARCSGTKASEIEPG